MSLKIPNFTIWAFATNNYKRPNEEVNSLFNLFTENLFDIVSSGYLETYGIRVNLIGEKGKWTEELLKANDYLCEYNKKSNLENVKLNLQVAINYDGREEIVESAKTLLVENEELTSINISKSTYTSKLGLPPVDSIFRTSGENILSGFMLWDCQDAKFYITHKNFPDLDEIDFLLGIKDLINRDIRKGK